MREPDIRTCELALEITTEMTLPVHLREPRRWSPQHQMAGVQVCKYVAWWLRKQPDYVPPESVATHEHTEALRDAVADYCRARIEEAQRTQGN